MTRVLHTADTHLGYRQYHSPARRDDFLDAFEAVAEDAVDADVDAVVHAGDLYHDRRPDLPDLLGTLGALRRLDDAGIPFLAVVGNHESTRHGQWLDLFERLGLAERLTDEPRAVGDVALYGLDHVPRARRDDLDYDFAPHDRSHAALVAHGLFTPFAHADWETETVLESSSVDFDAMLLGDNHVPGTERVDGTWVTYPGSTERTSASERDPRGYNLVTFDDGVDVRRRTLDTREFVFVDVDLSSGEGADRVRERVSQHDVTDAVVVVTIDGEGDPVAPAEIEETALDDGALVARVTDRREVDAPDEGVDVQFADPDAVVRERVADLGLSSAGTDVDRVVRDDAVADSNVRETVERRVRERLDDGELTGATDGDASVGDGADAGGTDGTDAAGGTDGTDADDGTSDGTDADDGTSDGTDADDGSDQQVTMEDYS